MNRPKDLFYTIALIFAALFLFYYFVRVPKAHGQVLKRFEFVETKSLPPSSDEDILFARGDSLFVKLQDGREIFTGETQKDGKGYFSIFPERAYFLLDSIKQANALELPSWQGLDSIKALDDTSIFFSEGTFTQLGWVTDSIKWVATDTTFEGDKCHEHDWVYSESYATVDRIEGSLRLKSNGLLACISGYHQRYGRYAGQSHDYEEHCPYDVLEREKICRKCLCSVIEREKWFQHYVEPPKTEFQKLKEKQRAKP